MIAIAEPVLAACVVAYRGMALPAVEIPGALEGAALDAARAAVRDRAWTRADLANRGCYAYADDDVPEALAEGVRKVASRLTGSDVTIAAARWYRLGRGDYSLHLDDAVFLREHPGVAVEAVVDVSARATGEAEVVFTHRGQSFFVPRQTPGSLAVVERGQTVLRYDRYLTHRVGGLVVDRLRVLLR